MTRREFNCDTEGFAAAQAFLESCCDEPKPSVIMDEIVSNIVRCSGAKHFSIGFDRADTGIEMTFQDDGRPFDPTTEVADPDINASLADRKIGGLGIFLVKKMSKSVDYVRENDKNCLTVRL